MTSYLFFANYSVRWGSSAQNCFHSVVPCVGITLGLTSALLSCNEISASMSTPVPDIVIVLMGLFFLVQGRWFGPPLSACLCLSQSLLFFGSLVTPARLLNLAETSLHI